MAEMIFMAGGCRGETEKESPIVGLRSCSIITIALRRAYWRCLAAAGRGPAFLYWCLPAAPLTMNELSLLSTMALSPFPLLSYCLFCPFSTSHSELNIWKSGTFTCPANIVILHILNKYQRCLLYFIFYHINIYMNAKQYFYHFEIFHYN